MEITKKNYQDLVWDENIPDKAYHDFYGTLNFEERVNFLRFLLEKYPDYDEEWIQYYFDLSDKWENEAQWEDLIDFVNFVREKNAKVYQKRFMNIDRIPVLYALFHNDLENVKIRFAETVAQPEEAIDDTLRTVFNLLSTNINHKAYTKEVAEKVWKPLENSDKLMGGAEFNYSAYLYCDFLATAFDTIHAGQSVDWEDFTQKVENINFKMIDELLLLPDLHVSIEEDIFQKNEAYRNEKLNSMLVSFMYTAHTQLGIPVYWAFRTWFDWRKYLVDSEDASKRKNWFAFTPKMIDRMGGNLHGFIGENRTGMFNVSMTIPYLYDYFLQQGYIDETIYTRLMEYYDFYRRELLKVAGQSLWQYKGVYTWKKPNFITEDRFRQEEALMLDSINWKYEHSRKHIADYTKELASLPKSAAPPPPEPSPWEKMMTTNSQNVLGAPSGKRPTNRPKKKRKKKHKDNRKKGNKKRR